MPPKPKKQTKDKKKPSKESEAEKLEEERRQKEALEKEEIEKYGITSFIKEERIPMLLTEWFTKECWINESPRKFAREHLLKMFERVGIDKKIRDDEIDMYSNSIIYNLIYAKDKLKFDDKMTSYFINLMFFLFTNGDKRFQVDYTFIGDKKEEEDEEEEESKKKGKDKKKGKQDEEEEFVLVDEEEEFDREEIPIDSSVLENKSYEEDLKSFKTLISKLVKSDINLFNKEQIARIVTYSIDNYFNNYNLFNYCQKNEQTEENIYLQVSYFIIPKLGIN